MIATNKQLLISESHSDLNRMYTLQGKTWPTHHTPSTLDLRMVLDLSLVSTKLKQAPTLERSLDNQRQTGPTIILGGLILPPMRQPWSSGKKFWPSGYIATSAYWAHKHQHVIGTFNTCSRGAAHRSLTDTGGGYNLGGANLPHTTPWPSQPVVSTFHLQAPPGLQFDPVPSTKPNC
jgi:hypothetical protein